MLPPAQEFERFGCDALCKALGNQDIHDDILGWLKQKKYNGCNFVQSGTKIIERMRQVPELDEIHVDAFEQLQRRVSAQYQEEAGRAQVRVAAALKAQLEAEQRAAQKRVGVALEAREALARQEDEPRRQLATEEAKLREALRQQRTTVGAEIAKRVQEAIQTAETAKKAEEAQQTKARQETKKMEEAKRLAASKPSERVARTTAMRADPLKRVNDWYKGPREAQEVGALEWELGRKGSELMTFKEAEAYAASRAAEGWRLPTIWELEALYQQRSVLGDDLDTGWFWSSVAVVGVPVFHWGLNFGHGDVDDVDDVYRRQVRLVRFGRGI